MKPSQDNIDHFKSQFSEIVQLSDSCWEQFLRLISYRKLNANEYFSKEMSLTKELGFILDGLIRIYSIDEEGVEWNKSLLRPNEYIMASINPTLPSPVNIQAVFPTEIFTIGYNDFMKLTLVCPDLKNLIQKLASQHLDREKNRNNLLMIKKSSERLEHFKTEFASIYQSIPKKQIASYIGVAIEDLKF